MALRKHDGYRGGITQDGNPLRAVGWHEQYVNRVKYVIDLCGSILRAVRIVQ